MSERDKERDIDVENVLNFVGLLAEAILAWQAFKNTHNLTSQHIQCCEQTRHFHAAMDALADHITNRVKH